MDLYRQGDVTLIPVDVIPSHCRFTARKKQGYPRDVKGIVLAAGEATGHHHRIEERSARLYGGTLDNDRYVKLSGNGATIVHEEHDPVPVPAGTYKIQRQREHEAPKDDVSAARTHYVYD
jgi:hypothetical protein